MRRKGWMGGGGEGVSSNVPLEKTYSRTAVVRSLREVMVIATLTWSRTGPEGRVRWGVWADE